MIFVFTFLIVAITLVIGAVFGGAIVLNESRKPDPLAFMQISTKVVWNNREYSSARAALMQTWNTMKARKASAKPTQHNNEDST